MDVIIPPKNTGIAPGPMLTDFKENGVPTKIDQGTIWIMKETIPVKKGEVISEANSNAELLIGEARESAEVLAEKKREEATKEASAIVAKAHEAGALEQEQLRAELKRDVGRLIIDTTTKVTGKVLTDDDQAKINEETSSQVSL